jgi:hypothetical protein
MEPWAAGGLSVPGGELARPVRIARDDGFELRLPQRFAGPGNHTAIARVEAVGAQGERILLAEGNVTTHRADVELAERAVGGTAVDLGATSSLQNRTRDAGSALLSLGNETSSPDVAEEGYDTLCPAPTPQCGLVSGNPGLGQIQPCRPPPPMQQNLFAYLLGTAVQTVDTAARGALGRGVCDPLANDVNATWDAASDLLPGVAVPVEWPEPVTGVDVPHVADAPVPELRHEETSWTNFTLDVSPNVSLPGDEHAIVLAPGYTLFLSLRLESTSASLVRSGHVILYGAPSAAASLVVRTDTEDAFGILSGGKLRPLGVHFDTLAATSYDEHQYIVPEGLAVRVSLAQGPGILRLWEANGSLIGFGSGNTTAFTLPAGVERIIHVRVVQSGAAPDMDYAVSVMPHVADEGVVLEDGGTYSAVLSTPPP